MSLAAASTSYPLLNIFWTMFVFFLWVAWIWPALFLVVLDIFRSRDLSGWRQGPVGPVRGGHPADRRAGVPDRPRRRRCTSGRTQRALGQDQEIRDFGQQHTGPSPADQLATLADLRDRGVITADEFDREKAKVLV